MRFSLVMLLDECQIANALIDEVSTVAASDISAAFFSKGTLNGSLENSLMITTGSLVAIKR
ncbi:hypothetical protein HDF11_003397 [Tunturiibacter psychrotolerans]|jgi:hypothetical protein